MPLMKVEAKTGHLVCSPVPGTGQPRRWEEIPAGTHIIPDYGVRYFGSISFSPTISEIPVLDGSPPPQVPEGDGRTWQSFIAFPVLVEGRGLFKYSATGEINQRRNASCLEMWKVCPQAQAGQLQEYRTRPFEKVQTNYGDYCAVVWEPLGWVDRDEVFITFRHELERIRERFPAAVELGADRIDAWNRGEIEMLVAHPASAGHGVNLQGGSDTIAWFSLPWSAELFAQANARLTRQGQRSDTVNIHIMLTHGGIDEIALLAVHRRIAEQERLIVALQTPA